MFKMLSSETRVRILQLLQRRPPCVAALASRAAGGTSAAVSQHLRILPEAGLVTSEKRGYHVHYSVNEETLERCKKMAEELLSPPGEWRPPRERPERP